MVDFVDSTTRSRIMSSIKSRNTKPEMIVRSLLHNNGFRFRIHRKDLSGRPDIVLPKYRAIIFIHGCFWHGHEGCRLFKLPTTRPEFWKAKITRNQENGAKSIELLLASGWRVCVIWECVIQASKKDPKCLIELLSNWIRSSQPFLEINDGIKEHK